MLIVLPKPIKTKTDEYINVFNLNSPNTIRVCKRGDVHCVALTQDFYKNFQKYYFISEHKSPDEAFEEINNILDAFENEEKIYRITPNIGTTIPPEYSEYDDVHGEL